MARLSGTTASVTGAGSGIGRAVAGRVARDGARAVIADRDEAAFAAGALCAVDGGMSTL